MKVCKFKYFAILFALVIVPLFCIFSVLSENAFAWSTNYWRPSIEINKAIDSNNARLSECTSALDFSKDYIQDYDGISSENEQKVSKMQAKFDDLDNYIKVQRPELEQITKNSYATYFAKGLLDEIVGNNFVTDVLFRWSFVALVSSGEDTEVSQLVEDYYSLKHDLDNAIEEKDNAEKTYQTCLDNIENLPKEINEINNAIEFNRSILPEILEIEKVYGAAGESRIEGDNLFCHPCPGSSVSSSFGEQRDGYIHHGIDMCANSGSPIYAACNGVVLESGQNDSMGNYIKIQHENGLVSIYMHCSHLFVPSGMQVCKGDNIALVGSTGDSEAPHLHFQVELNGNPVNGFDYL